MELFCSIFRRALKGFPKMYITWRVSLACSTVRITNPKERQALVLQRKRTPLMPNRHRNGFTGEELTWECSNTGMEIFSFQKMVGNIRHSRADWSHKVGVYVTNQKKWPRSHPGVLMKSLKLWWGLLLNPTESESGVPIFLPSFRFGVYGWYLPVSLRSARAAVHVPLTS